MAYRFPLPLLSRMASNFEIFEDVQMRREPHGKGGALTLFEIIIYT
jgi:hypothetical protein